MAALVAEHCAGFGGCVTFFRWDKLTSGCHRSLDPHLAYIAAYEGTFYLPYSNVMGEQYGMCSNISLPIYSRGST
jgi:hypothetical protein